VRIRLGAIQKIDQSLNSQLTPCLQSQQVFLLVDQVLRLHSARQYPRLRRHPDPAGDPITNGRHFVTQYAAPARPAPYLGRV